MRPLEAPHVESVTWGAPAPVPAESPAPEGNPDVEPLEAATWTLPGPAPGGDADGEHAVRSDRSLAATWTGHSAAAPSPRTRLAFDFGVGEHRYDDGVRSLDPLPQKSAGFSDSVLQLGVTRRLSPGASWTSGLAAFRNQDEPILDDLDATELGWVTVGIQFQF